MTLDDEQNSANLKWDTLFTLELFTSGVLSGIAIPYTALKAAVTFLISSVITSRNLDKIGTCDECAELVKIELMRSNISGRHIRLETNAKNGVLGLIWDDGTEQQIATAGFHEAIVVNLGGEEVVFDNIYPQGKPYREWQMNLVVSPGNELKLVKNELF